MALVDLMARLRADPTGFRAGLASAQRDLTSFQAQTYTAARNVTGAFAGIGRAATGLAGLLAPLGVAMSLGSLVNSAREFESAMGVIQAASGATGRDLQTAEQVIRDVGVAMRFGASETATAAEELLKAGLAVDDLANGALRASVILAAATGGTMADGANIAVRAMQNFHIAASDLDTVVRQAAGVINATTFSLQDYSLALGMAGNAAASMGVTLEDFNATVALTASAFSSGSDAGTSFKTFLQRMAAPVGPAADEIERLGISIYDAQGRFVGMEEVANRLHRAFEGMTQQERARIVVTIAGADAQRTMNVLINEGAGAFRRMRDETLQQADANAMAQARFSGLNGTIAQLSANWEELGIALGQSGVTAFLADFIRGLAGVVALAREAVEWMNRLNPNYSHANSGDIADLERELARQRDIARQRSEQVQRDNAMLADASRNGRTLAPNRLAPIGEHLDELLATEQRVRELERAIDELRYPIADVRRDLGAAVDPVNDAIRAADQYAASLTNAGHTGAAAEREITAALQYELRKRKELSEQAAHDRIEMHRQVLADMTMSIEAAGPTLRDRMNATVDGFAEAASSELERAFVNGEVDWDNIGDSLLRDWRQVLWDVFVGDDVREILTSIARQLKGLLQRFITEAFPTAGSGGGGFWSTAANWIMSLFGGGRAGGGPVRGGTAYKVGEHGPEMFVAPGLAGGNIVPLANVASERSAAVTLTYAPAIDARGVDAAQVARIEQTQRELLSNFEEMTLRVVNSGLARRKIR